MALEGDVLADDFMENLAVHWNRSSVIIRTYRRLFKEKSITSVDLTLWNFFGIGQSQMLALGQILDYYSAFCHDRPDFHGSSEVIIKQKIFQGRNSRILVIDNRYLSQESSRVDFLIPRP